MINQLFYEIITHSMYPALAPGDKVLCHKTEDIKLNDIVVINPSYFLENDKDPFYRDMLKEEVPLIHRVIEVKEIDGIMYYKTKGDFTWRVDAATSLIEENDTYLVYEYDESKAYIPSSEILGKILKIIKKKITCPTCQAKFPLNVDSVSKDLDVIEGLPHSGLRYELKIFKKGDSNADS